MSFHDRIRELRNIIKPDIDQVQREDQRLMSQLVDTRIPSARQLKYLPSLFTSEEKRVVGVLGLLTVACLVGLVGLWYAGSSGKPAEGGEYREAVIGYPQWINPVLAQSGSVDAMLSSLVYRKLFVWDETGVLAPDLVSRYEVGDSGKRYTIHLNQALWEDGEVVSPDDIVFTFSLIQDPEVRSPLYRRFAGIGVEAQGDDSVVFTLPEAYGLFPSLLTVGILPQHLWFGSTGGRLSLSSMNQKPIGNGAFKFSRFGRDEGGSIRFFEFVRNDKFGGVRAFLDTVKFSFYPDQKSAREAFSNGVEDGFVPRQSAEGALQSFEQSKGIVVDRGRQPEMMVIGFNTKSEMWKSRDARSAFSSILDRGQLIENASGGYGSVVTSFFDANPINASSTQNDLFDLSAFASAMERAGWKREDGKWKNSKGPFAFTLGTLDTLDMHSVAKFIRDRALEQGIGVEVEFLDPLTFRERLKSHSYEAVLMNIDMGWAEDYYSLLHSSQGPVAGFNVPLYANREVDLGLQKIRSTQDEEERAKAFASLKRVVDADVPWLPLFVQQSPFIHRSKLKGVPSNMLARFDDRLMFANRWYVDMRRW